MVVIQRWYYMYRNGDQSNSPFEFFYDNLKIKNFDELLSVLTELYGRHIKGGRVLKLYKVEKTPIPARICNVSEFERLADSQCVFSGNEAYVKIHGGYGERVKDNVSINPVWQKSDIRKRATSAISQTIGYKPPTPPSVKSGSDSGLGSDLFLQPGQTAATRTSSDPKIRSVSQMQYSSPRRDPYATPAGLRRDVKTPYNVAAHTSWKRIDSTESNKRRDRSSRLTRSSSFDSVYQPQTRHETNKYRNNINYRISDDNRRKYSDDSYRNYNPKTVQSYGRRQQTAETAYGDRLYSGRPDTQYTDNTTYQMPISRLDSPLKKARYGNERRRGSYDSSRYGRYDSASTVGYRRNGGRYSPDRQADWSRNKKGRSNSNVRASKRASSADSFYIRLAELETGRLPKTVGDLHHDCPYLYVPITQKFKDIEYQMS